MSRTIGTILATAVAFAGCQTSAPPPAKPAAEAQPAASRPQMEPPAHVSEETREAISKTMADHGDDVTLLFWSVLFLDVDGAGEYAEAIAARQVDLSDEEAAKVPRSILRLHGQLRDQANDAAKISKRGREAAPEMAQKLGEMTTTCVSCHSAYLYPPKEKAPE